MSRAEKIRIALSSDAAEARAALDSILADLTNGLGVLANVAREFSDALRQGEVDPMEFKVVVRTVKP